MTLSSSLILDLNSETEICRYLFPHLFSILVVLYTKQVIEWGRVNKMQNTVMIDVITTNLAIH